MAVIVLCLWSAAPYAQQPAMEEIVALHWLESTQTRARAISLHAASVLANDQAEDQLLEENALVWSSLQQQQIGVTESPWVASHLSDGHFGYWVSQAGNAQTIAPLSWQDIPPDPVGQWSIWQAQVAREVPAIWGLVDPSIVEASFGELIDEMSSSDDNALEHARTQATRVVRMHNARSPVTRQIIEGSLILAEARYQWDRGNHLASAWLSLEGLMGMHQTRLFDNARFYSAWLSSLPQPDIRQLRSIDMNFPLIMALLIDSANHLSADESPELAGEKLASAYHYLALFVPNLAGYLDQPVRDQMRALQSRCGPDRPMEDGVVADCVASIMAVLTEQVDTEELVGANGPLSVQFLTRELDLVTWQRARYLDSYVNWMFGAPCSVPDWFNVVEWNLGVHWLLGLTPEPDQTPPAIDDWDLSPLTAQYQQWQEQSSAWLECLSAVDEQAPDLMLRLVSEQSAKLDALAELIADANQRFHQAQTRPSADIDLNQPLPTSTEYRGTGLRVRPCDASRACGARVELPVNEALLSLVPDGYWLADQLQLGQVDFCYDNVRWIDRQLQPARHNDAGVANFGGRLSFELKASFVNPQQDREWILARRLESDVRQNYFFGRADPANLEMDCPHGLEGRPIESALSEAASGLVPKRLTYFTSIPTSAGAHLLNHWAQGEMWRDAFVDTEKVEVLQSADDLEIREKAQAHIHSLVDRRERSLATRLSNFEGVESGDELTSAMLEIDAMSRLMRRVMELHYSSMVRMDDALRGAVAGQQSLLGREDIRRARDEGVKMAELPSIGQTRIDAFTNAWARWPTEIRQGGQVPPELQVGLIALQALSHRGPDQRDESPEDPKNTP